MTGRGGGAGTQSRRRALPRIAAATVGLVMITGACSSSAGGTKPIGANTTGGPRSTATSSSTIAAAATTTLDPTRSTILARYRAGQAAFLAVASHYPVVPTDARIPAFMTGTLLNTVRSRLTIYALQGDYVQGTAELGPTVVSVNGTEAIVMDCGFDHSVVVNGRTGQREGNPADTQRTKAKVTMQLVDGVWKMAALEQEGAGCVPPAA